MKIKLTFALAAILTSSAFAAFKAPLPEFKTEKQLAEWRTEMAAKEAATSTSNVPSAFYTGKPYLESSSSYAFKYRSYNPELARWTSEDPSGFPDGANSNIYAPCPTTGFDLVGLFAVDLNGFVADSDSWVDDDNYKYTVATKKMSVLAASDFSGSLTGWNFTAGSLNVTMTIKDYTPFALDGYGTCNFGAAIGGVLPTGENWSWVQIVTCNTAGAVGKTGTFLDNNYAGTNPFYRGTNEPRRIIDQPSRSYSGIGTMAGGGPVSWSADTYYVKYSGNDVTVFGGVRWGFTIDKSLIE